MKIRNFVEDDGGGMYFRKLGHVGYSKACVFVLFLLVELQLLRTLETFHRALTGSVTIVLQLVGEI